MSDYDQDYDDCQHVHRDYQPADPSVGIMSESLICEDCGADLTDEAREAAEDARADRILARMKDDGLL